MVEAEDADVLCVYCSRFCRFKAQSTSVLQDSGSPGGAEEGGTQVTAVAERHGEQQ